jgi:hypothetical protein
MKGTLDIAVTFLILEPMNKYQTNDKKSKSLIYVNVFDSLAKFGSFLPLFPSHKKGLVK